jgi:hypothetical protein
MKPPMTGPKIVPRKLVDAKIGKVHFRGRECTSDLEERRDQDGEDVHGETAEDWGYLVSRVCEYLSL